MVEDEGAIVLVCIDDLCAILEENDRQAQAVVFSDPASNGVSLANYTVEIPCSAKTCSDWPGLEAAMRQRHSSRVVNKYGGYSIKEYGMVAVACDEKMFEKAGRSQELVDLLYDDTEEAPSQW